MEANVTDILVLELFRLEQLHSCVVCERGQHEGVCEGRCEARQRNYVWEKLLCTQTVLRDTEWYGREEEGEETEEIGQSGNV